MADKRVPMMEAFGPTVQGEGLLLGVPTNFLRLGGCTFRCTWCDTMYAVDPVQVKANARYLTTTEICQELAQLPHAPWLTISGGDPVMHKPINDIIMWCRQRGIKVAIETQAALWQDWLLNVDVVTFSPKGPSSGNLTEIDFLLECVQKLITRSHVEICVKPVVFNGADLQYALDVMRALRTQGGKGPLLVHHFTFQAGTVHAPEAPVDDRPGIVVDNVLTNYRALVEQLKDVMPFMPHNVSIKPQTHVLLWPEVDRGR